MKTMFCAVAIMLALGSACHATLIDFDSLPAGTVITNQYPEAVFSSEPGFVPASFPFNGLDGSSSPNVLAPSYVGLGYPASMRNLYVDFPTPVNGLSFLAIAPNEYGVVARINVYSGVNLLGTNNLIGLAASPGTFGLGSVVVNLSAYAMVTRIEVVPPLGLPDIDNSYNGAGIAYDNFSFESVPEPSSFVLLALGGLAALVRRRRA